MERRKSSRKPVHQPVDLDSPHAGPLSGFARDVSLGGMFVETGPATLPPIGSVAVSFKLQQDGRQHAFLLDAAVVRREPHGVGLMFLQMEPDEIRALSDALAWHPDTP
jgi:hypothetical protein